MFSDMQHTERARAMDAAAATADVGAGYVIPPASRATSGVDVPPGGMVSPGGRISPTVGRTAEGEPVYGESAAEQLAGVEREGDGVLCDSAGRKVVGATKSGTLVYAVSFADRDRLTKAARGGHVLGVDPQGRPVVAPMAPEARVLGLGKHGVVVYGEQAAAMLPGVERNADGALRDTLGKHVVGVTAVGLPVYKVSKEERLAAAVEMGVPASNIVGVD